MENDSTPQDPTLEKRLTGHKNFVTSVFYSPNEQQVASGSLDNSVMVWDLSSSSIKSKIFHGHEEAVTDVTFSPAGKQMASVSRDKTVRIWVPSVTRSVGVFKAHSQTVRSVQFSPIDGNKILTASDDKIVKLWSSNKYKFIASFVGHTNWVRCARMSNDGSIIASCSDDKTARLWNPDSGELIHTYKDQKGHGTYLAWHPSSCYIAVGTSQGNVKLFDIRTHTLVQYYSLHNDAISQLAFHPSGSYIVTASRDGTMKILDLLEGHPIYTLTGHSSAVTTVNFSPSGASFISGGEDKEILIWKTNFTELARDSQENVGQKSSAHRSTTSQSSRHTTQRPASSTKWKNQGTRLWHLCYHSTKYPTTIFSQLDDVERCTNSGRTYDCVPNAHSTLVECHNSKISSDINDKSLRFSNRYSTQKSVIEQINANGQNGDQELTESPHSVHSSHNQHCLCHNNLNEEVGATSGFSEGQSREFGSQCPNQFNDVGHLSHIPRLPPNPSTFTIPSLNHSMDINIQTEENLFGMIKLKDNDVCYTSGTIEWVGRKRGFPINTGFKVLESLGNEPLLKKSKRLDKTNVSGTYNMQECDCGDVLPTVNAIVEHLNALHEAVDIVDLRLNTLENVLSKTD